MRLNSCHRGREVGKKVGKLHKPLASPPRKEGQERENGNQGKEKKKRTKN